jgi:CRISPR-associated protein Cas1
MDAFESRVLDLRDFYFTGDDYRYRFDPEAKRRFLRLLSERFNSGVRYESRALRWDTVIERKAVQLGQCLAGRTRQVDFCDPPPNLRAKDDSDLRKRVLGLSQSNAQRIGIRKSTLHYLRKNAQKQRPLEVYQKLRERLMKD